MKIFSRNIARAIVCILLLVTCGATAQIFSKNANTTSGTAPLKVIYTYKLYNNGDKAFNEVYTPVDDKCSPVKFQGGDDNSNQIVDIGESWAWTCTAVLNATTMNTAGISVANLTCEGLLCSRTIYDFAAVHTTVSIIPPEPLTVSIDGPQSTCANSPVSLTAAVTGGTPPYNFAWTDGSTSQTITPNVSAPGILRFGVTVTDGAAESANANTTLTIRPNCLIKVMTPDPPLKTTIEWGCEWRFAGQCFFQTILKVCIGGSCIDNPNTLQPPPICRACSWFAGGVAGIVIGLATAFFFWRMRGGFASGPRPPA